jgi:hypothetical protein
MARSPTQLLLSISGGNFDERIEEQLKWFVRFLPMHLACREWVRYLEQSDELRLIVGLGFSGLFIFGLRRDLGQWAWAALALVLIRMIASFPMGSNHFGVEFLCVFFVALFGNAEREARPLLVTGLRWLFIWVFFFSGVQKLLHGTYFHGEYFAGVLAYGDARFWWALEPLLSQADIANLKSGPENAEIVLHSVPALVLSNGIWVGEMLIGVLLVWRRTRPWATILAAVGMLGIEWAARELMFGVLAINLIALFAPAQWSRRAFWLAAAVYAVVIGGLLLGTPLEHFN